MEATTRLVTETRPLPECFSTVASGTGQEGSCLVILVSRYRGRY